MRRRGFTLVELLVVVAVIALLLAILLPSLHLARERAKRTICAANLHAIGVAIYNYWTEWNGRVPYVWSPMTNGAFGDPKKTDAEIDPFDRLRWSCALPNVLMPTYMGEEPGVFRCPAALNGWPRAPGSKRYTYRPAAVNQPNGVATEEDTYARESFGFLDGRILWDFRMDLVADPQSPAEHIHNAMEYAKSRGTFLRDLIQARAKDSDPVLGPHGGGTLQLNRQLQVEFRPQKVVQEDLAPNYAGSAF